MSSLSQAGPPAPEELAALMRLLDDETPEVRARVTERLSQCGGDISEWLVTWPGKLEEAERSLLSEILGSARNLNLQRDWIIPTGGAAALEDDWDGFEACLRSLSDFLHDGLTVRPSLSDAIDVLAEEAEEAGITGGRELGTYLFRNGPLVGNQTDPDNPSNADLAWAITNGRSTPIGLGILFILVGRRMGLDVEGVAFPGHFLCRVFEDGVPLIIDCFENGCPHLQEALLENPELDLTEQSVIRESTPPGSMLLLLMTELTENLVQCGREKDARLIRKLRRSMY